MSSAEKRSARRVSWRVWNDMAAGERAKRRGEREEATPSEKVQRKAR